MMGGGGRADAAEQRHRVLGGPTPARRIQQARGCYIGGPQGSARPSNTLIFDDTINAGNSATGTIYYDRVAVSTQRIGP